MLFFLQSLFFFFCIAVFRIHENATPAGMHKIRRRRGLSPAQQSLLLERS
jgi:hypothetical protein